VSRVTDIMRTVRISDLRRGHLRAEFDEGEEEITFSPINVFSGSLQNNRSFCVGQPMRSSMTFKPHGIFMLLGSYNPHGLVTRVTANDGDYHRIGGLLAVIATQGDSIC
jgi:hypothetical protein